MSLVRKRIVWPDASSRPDDFSEKVGRVLLKILRTISAAQRTSHIAGAFLLSFVTVLALIWFL
jgi:hypothetical protein